MVVDLLDSPLRASWDIFSCTDASLSGTQLLNIASELAAAGVFFVTLENRPLQHPAIAALLERLLDGGCQVALVADADPAQLKQLEKLPKGCGPVSGWRLMYYR